MNHDRRNLIAGASIIGAAALVRAARAGDLNPPPGPVAPSGRALKDIEPRTPVQSLQGTVDYKYIITQAGSYYLNGDIVVAQNQVAILVTAGAGSVSIDMEGFSIRGGGAGGGGGGAIKCATPGPDYLEVCDGYIGQMSGDGIDSGGARVLDCYDLHVDQCGTGIRVRTNGLVEACHVERCAADGIALQKTTQSPNVFAVDECECRACGRYGVSVIGDWTSGDSTVCISDCDCVGNVQDGVNMFATASGAGASVSVTMVDCRSSSNGGFGHRLSNIGGAGSTGARCTVQMEDCVCSKNGLGGVRVASCVVDLMDVTCSHNTGDGFMLDNTQGSCDGCVASRNQSAGIRHVNQAAGEICDCSAHSNSNEGIVTDPTCVGLAITECSCRQNGTGFSIGSPNNLLLWNTASLNGVNYNLDPTMHVIVITPVDMAGNSNPHANYSA